MLINLLSYLRVILLLPLAWLLIMDRAQTWIVFGIFILAGVTDFLDGYLARRFNQTSTFGAMLDQISDKVFISCTLLALTAAGLLQGAMLIPVFVIIAREFMVSGLREYAAQQGRTIPVDKFGKIKTVLQFLALTFILVPPNSPPLIQINHIGAALLWLATLLALISGLRYGVSAVKSPE